MSGRYRTPLCLLTMLTLVTVTAAKASQVPVNSSPLDRSRELYLRGVQGDREATRDSSKLFRELLRQRPNDPLITAYQGSNDLLEAGRTLAIWKKGSLAKQGLTALDKAVAASPNNVEIRFIRAISTYHLPAMFHREEQCEQDFAAIAPRLAQAARTGELTPRLATAAFYYYGLLRERKGDRGRAAELWRSAVSISSTTPAGAEAARRLKQM